MIIMGIDPSLNGTGWCVVDSNTMSAIKYGIIQHSKNTSEAEKLRTIYYYIYDLIFRFNVEAVAVEAEYCGMNRLTGMKLSHVHGSIMASIASALDDLDNCYKEYAVMTAKSVCLLPLGGLKKNDSEGNKKTNKQIKEEIRMAMCIAFDLPKDVGLDISDAASMCFTFIKKEGVDNGI